MDRSLGFGSNPQYYVALFRLAFATASPLQLNLALQINSLAHYAKGTLSPRLRKARTACRQLVSGSISLP